MSNLLKKEKALNDSGVIYRRTALGEAIFILEKDKDESHAICISNLRPSDWTVKQMRTMADFMEANPNVTIFDDGSGEPIRMK